MARPDPRRCRRPAAFAAGSQAVALAALAALLSACYHTRRVALTPDARGTPVLVTFAGPRDVVIGRVGADSLSLRGVQRLQGRLDGRAGDTLVLSPLTFAATTAGGIADPGAGRVATARVPLGEGVAAAGTHRAFSGKRTALLVGGVVAAYLAVGAVAASQMF